jgi:hypothetical protein
MKITMNILLKAILAPFILCAIGASIGAPNANVIENTTQEPIGSNGSLNESQYLAYSNYALTGLEEDSAFSSAILTKYAEKNITDNEALALTMAVYNVITHAKDMLSSFSPPKKYEEYHKNILSLMTCSQNYLWNMGRFYETHKVDYVRQARNSYNLSIIYHDKIIEQKVLNK